MKEKKRKTWRWGKVAGAGERTSLVMHVGFAAERAVGKVRLLYSSSGFLALVRSKHSK